jgi:formylglycine-generating enzyme required for sulfatase activity
VAEAVKAHTAFVLLGPPGCGKSTVLRRLALDAARAVLAGHETRLPLRLNLAYYNTADSPLEFVSRTWQNERLPDDFVSLARAGQALLLADGLNEMERLSEDKQARRAKAWRDFIAAFFGDPANPSRVIIASRDQADYSDPLDLPRVEIEPLDDDQIEAFLQAYLAEQAGTALAALKRLDLLAHAQNPYQLSVLAALYARQGEALPTNRGMLFGEYARWLIEREEEVGHPRWIRPEAQLLALAHLGYHLQAHSESTVLPADRLLALLPASVRLGRATVPINPEDQFDLACRAGILIPDPAATGGDPHKFSHQLLQEQFAARHLLARWQAGDDEAALWRAPRTHAEMPTPQVGESHGEAAHWDPLPPPSPTGWEQTTILAAGMTDRPDVFIRAVLAANPALAGRCLAEGGPEVSQETRVAVQQALLQDLSDPALHRRARIQAGRVLGNVGDPRLEPATINGVEVILPDLVEVPGGTATLGSAEAEAYEDEQPVHQVEVATFCLTPWPVTNAEYRCFMNAGGYDTEHYWTPAGWQWRQGQAETRGAVETIMDYYRALAENPGLIDQWFKEGRITRDWAESWRELIKFPEDQVREMATSQYGQRRTDQPYFWDDPAYNQANQPVVGVTWYEAMAYCAWLNEQLARGQGAGDSGQIADGRWQMAAKRSGQPSAVGGQSEVVAGLAAGTWQVRLPTEAEWEWAAGGPQHQRYPWGPDFDSDKANTLEGRILGTTPVGAYPAGVAQWCGALDLSGNVYEWTHSLYQPYPYRADDGREDDRAEGRRAVRGGSWSLNQGYVRVSSRNYDPPDDFDDNGGFRVSVAPVFS